MIGVAFIGIAARNGATEPNGAISSAVDDRQGWNLHARRSNQPIIDPQSAAAETIFPVEESR